MVLELTPPEIRRTNYTVSGFAESAINRVEREGHPPIIKREKHPTALEIMTMRIEERRPLIGKLQRELATIKTKYKGKYKQDPNFQAEAAPTLSLLRSLEGKQIQELNNVRQIKQKERR